MNLYGVIGGSTRKSDNDSEPERDTVSSTRQVLAKVVIPAKRDQLRSFNNSKTRTPIDRVYHQSGHYKWLRPLIISLDNGYLIDLTLKEFDPIQFKDKVDAIQKKAQDHADETYSCNTEIAGRAVATLLEGN